jgi:sulfate adenylyltransferase
MSDTYPIAPHGGTLIDLLATGDAAANLAAEAANLPKLVINERELSDLEMLAVGALSPLTGFQGEDDYHGVLESMHLTNGVAWAIPVVLGLSDEDLHRIGNADAIALCPSEGADPVAVLRVTGQFKRDKQKEAVAVYRTDDLEHPGVKAMYDSGDTCVAGTLEVIALPSHDDFVSYRLTPAQTRNEFQQRGWKTVVGFQTRNPIHRAHEYLQKCALEIVDGLLVHPLMGATKADDVPPDVRMRCYEALFSGY